MVAPGILPESFSLGGHDFSHAETRRKGKQKVRSLPRTYLRSKIFPLFLPCAAHYVKNVRDDISNWDPDPAEVDKLLLGLQKAGLTFGPTSA